MSYQVRSFSGTEGVPGKVFNDPSWILTEVVSVRNNGTSVRVSDLDGFRGTDIKIDLDGIITFNGEYVDVSDDFGAWLGFLDEVAELLVGPTFQLDPYEED